MAKVTWTDKSTKYLARSLRSCSGIFVTGMADIVKKNEVQRVVVLQPATATGRAARCQIEVPVEHLGQFVEALKLAAAEAQADYEKVMRYAKGHKPEESGPTTGT